MANRTPLIAGNWKLNKTTDEAVALATEIAKGADAPNVDILVSPVFTALASVAKALEGSKELVNAEGRGAIAAFSPSSLSVQSAASLYHEALVAELASGHHERLGDAILAAQTSYADAGAGHAPSSSASTSSSETPRS